MMARILVTGSEGLVGSAARRWLTFQGHQVLGLDTALPPDDPEYGDILNFEALKTRLYGVTGVVHLAAVSRVTIGEADPERCWAVNVTGTSNVVRAAAAVPGKPWVVTASSREVYGEPDRLPVREEDAVQPRNVYGRSKAAGEAITMAARAEGIRTAIVRLASVYGSVDDHQDRVVPAFCRAAARGSPMRIEGPDYTFDFTHVADVVEALGRMVSRMLGQEPPPPVVHLVSGTPTTLRDLAQLANSAAGDRSELLILDNKPHNVSRFVGDPERAERILGWRVRIPLEEGVRRLVREFMKIDRAARGGEAPVLAKAASDRQVESGGRRIS